MRRTKADAEKTRNAILEAAEALFLERGVAHTSLEHIARHAGVTRGAVYWHFANKADLFTAMINQVRLPPEVLAERLLGCPQQDPLLNLRYLCIEALTSLIEDQKKQRIFTILLRRCEFTDELRPAEERQETFIRAFIQLCEQQFDKPGVRARLYPGINPHIAARAVHAMIIGLFHEWIRDRSLFMLQDDVAPMIDSCFRGLVREWRGQDFPPCRPDQAKPTS
ncbi:TetR family transcriptional regulator [Pseudomonas sp. 5P_3.1_Bac2]|uniref:TetR family transcriptional regulator n=1 Tax=Pseudomonas sp. 5P_3.1_Bac2 TaxID=2971617 RepID=UPI0021C61849|nr:TetR family transcriptional regulator [Pseudomonas sp. 5P_3.1_Bac2]MCU1719392.1 TetR family transcriptional regulator [Pseudomonas sp. 5P_3.1_Bac2]